MILEQFASVFNYIFFLKNCYNKRNMSLSKSLISAITKKAGRLLEAQCVMQ